MAQQAYFVAAQEEPVHKAGNNPLYSTVETGWNRKQWIRGN
jgi:hypothetical protein